MEAKFTNGDDKLHVSLEESCNVMEIWNDAQWNIIHLNNEQIDELHKMLTKWKER